LGSTAGSELRSAELDVVIVVFEYNPLLVADGLGSAEVVVGSSAVIVTEIVVVLVLLMVIVIV